MRIVVIGASGYVGSHILSEALARGHDVTAIVGDATRVSPAPGLKVVGADATRPEELARLAADHDLVISAYNPERDPDGSGTAGIIEGVKAAWVGRLIAVGGAGTLEIAPGQRLVDQSDFPVEWKSGALGTATFLDQLREERDLDWVFVSPAAQLEPGERTGVFRIGGDALMTDGSGRSRISLPDYAMAMLDEAERPAHHRERFSVAY